MTARINIDIGERFTKLVAVVRVASDRKGQQVWQCLCDCGNTTRTTAGRLKSGETKSCGCLKVQASAKLAKRNTTHGLTSTREYGIWNAMKHRCLNPRVKAYPRYGGRGIIVCPEWRESFEAFYRDMGPRPSPKHTLERVDNDGDYCKDNCAWATREEQARNMRSNALLTFQGQTMCITAWAEKVHIKPATVAARLRNGWSVEQALTLRPRGLVEH